MSPAAMEIDSPIGCCRSWRSILHLIATSPQIDSFPAEIGGEEPKGLIGSIARVVGVDSGVTHRASNRINCFCFVSRERQSLIHRQTRNKPPNQVQRGHAPCNPIILALLFCRLFLFQNFSADGLPLPKQRQLDLWLIQFFGPPNLWALCQRHTQHHYVPGPGSKESPITEQAIPSTVPI